MPRRDAVCKALVTSSGLSTLLNFPQSTWAARGAAELDFEFYIRDLLGGNPPQGNIAPSRLVPAGPPRTLQEPVLSLVLNDDCSSRCIPCWALIQLLLQQSQSESAIESVIQQRMSSYRSRASRSFYAAAPWKEDYVSDQYYFDLTAYACEYIKWCVCGAAFASREFLTTTPLRCDSLAYSC
jgi:hypothetical protein